MGIKFPVAGATVLFYGDSWTDRWGHDPAFNFPAILAAKHGWKASVHGGPGTGYIAGSRNGKIPAFPFRAAELDPAIAPDLIVLQGSINDVSIFDADKLREGAAETINTLRLKYPDAQMVMVGPAASTWGPSLRRRTFQIGGPKNLAQTDRILAGAAAYVGFPYISPTQERWINGGNIEDVISSSDRHPSHAGQGFLAVKIEEALRRLSGDGHVVDGEVIESERGA